MDATTKVFIFMVIFSILFGLVVIFVNPDYRISRIYQTNKSYYSGVTQETLKQKSRVVENVTVENENF